MSFTTIGRDKRDWRRMVAKHYARSYYGLIPCPPRVFGQRMRKSKGECVIKIAYHRGGILKTPYPNSPKSQYRAKFTLPDVKVKGERGPGKTRGRYFTELSAAAEWIELQFRSVGIDSVSP